MKTGRTTLLAATALTALLSACGGNAPDVKDPSKGDAASTLDTKAADPSVKPSDVTPAAAEAKPAADAKPSADAKPAADAPAEGKCKDGPKPAAKDSKSCIAECSKLDAKAPAGSKCMPPRTACEQQCKTLGK